MKEQERLAQGSSLSTVAQNAIGSCWSTSVMSWLNLLNGKYWDGFRSACLDEPVQRDTRIGRCKEIQRRPAPAMLVAGRVQRVLRRSPLHNSVQEHPMQIGS